MTGKRFDLCLSEERDEAWRHATAVICVPELPQIFMFPQHCQAVDKMILTIERRLAKTVEDGWTTEEYTELTALGHFWILGFFEMLRILTSRDYQKMAEFNVAGLEPLKNKANMARSAFAKLQRPGKPIYVFPSYSGIVGKKGLTYAVYDDQGKEIGINRRELADEFLRIMAEYQPSQRFKDWLESIRPTSLF